MAQGRKVGSLYWEIGADTAKFEKGLTGTKGKVSQLKNGLGSVTQELLGFNVASIAGAAALGTVAAIAKKSIAAASDLGETVNKVGAIFGKSSKDIVDWADETGASMGQSKKQMLDAASTFAVFAKSAGLAGDDLTGFSKELTNLASDLSSFYNTSPEEAILAIGAALRGESEPIRRYGVLLDDATLRQKALEMGIISTTKNALTPQQRVLASQAVILQQTTDAQGDFMRTSDGLANSQKILTAELEDLTAELGTNLLPVAIAVTKGLIDVAQATKLVLTWSRNLEQAIKDQGDALADTDMPYNKYLEQMKANAKQAGLLVDAQADGIKVYRLTSAGYVETANTLGILTRSEYAAKGATQGLNTELMFISTYGPGAWDSLNQLSVSAEASATAIEHTNAKMETLRSVSSQITTAYNDMYTAQANLATATEQFGEQVGGDLKSQFEQAGLKGDELRTVIGYIDENMGTAYGPAMDLEKITADLVKDYLDGGRDAEAFNQKLKDQLAPMQDLYQPIVDARVELQTVLETLKLLTNREWNIVIGMGAPLSIPGVGGGTSAGPAKGSTVGGGKSGVSIPTGLKGGPGGANGLDMIVPPGYPNDSYPIRAESGERVVVTPAGKRSGGGGINVTIHVNQISSTLDMHTLAYRVASEIQRRQ